MCIILFQPKQMPSLIGLQNSMLTMVNNPKHSDLQIRSAGGDTVFCHKVVLSCRCPRLLKVCQLRYCFIKFIFGTQLQINKYIFQFYK
jgi:hypothetical protein